MFTPDLIMNKIKCQHFHFRSPKTQNIFICFDFLSPKALAHDQHADHTSLSRRLFVYILKKLVKLVDKLIKNMERL